ncbi:MAG: tRNA (N(6)-L-threonylcarbamoyladenosine(37)-C(2))-methylthiotransferase MtaB [Vicinamibacterales bacterium]
MRYAIVTFGCRVNQADSLAVEDELRARGARSTPAHEADIVIVNTCSVTASADQGARQAIRRIARDNPAARVIVTGCYATRRPDEVTSLPNVLRIVTNEGKDALARELADAHLGRHGGDEGVAPTTAERFGAGDGACGEALEPGVAGRTALTLRVQTGCDERCSYCIIPKTRGAGRSRPLAGVLADLRRAVRAGYKEIVITGVHLGSYGRDLHDGTTLETLVRALAEWPDEVLFRVSSLEPMDCSDAIVDLVAESPRLAPHLHLPLQHGCDGILAEMGRPYTSAFYRRLVERIRARVPEAAIGSDVIVGFPGEEAEHAQELVSLLEALPLTHLHVFPYSDRPGTEASAMPRKVGGADIRARAAAVRAAGQELTRRFHASQVGAVRRALTVDDGSHVVTDNYLKLRIAPGRARNEWVQVRIGGSPGALEASLTAARSG